MEEDHHLFHVINNLPIPGSLTTHTNYKTFLLKQVQAIIYRSFRQNQILTQLFDCDVWVLYD